jgi:septal ring factor EnvC (AmiA/AmiB activator)
MEREELNRTLDEELLRLVRVTADRDALRAEVKRLNAWFGTDKELSTVTADRDRLKADNKKLQSALKDWETDADRLQQELDETHVQLRAAVAQIRT